MLDKKTTMHQYIELAIECRPPQDNNDLLTIKEFIEATKFPIDKLYIDKFWASLHDNQLIYVDDDLIRWMGFDAAQVWKRKDNFIGLLKNNEIDYIEYSNDEYATFFAMNTRKEIYPIPHSGKGTGTLKHILLNTDALKLAMLLIGRGRGIHVRKHYLALEKMFFTYFHYQCRFKQLSAEIELNQLRVINIRNIRARECALIDTSPLLECVYFIRGGEYVKIGRTTNIARRLIEIQICCPIKLHVERTIITDIGPTLESKIHGIYSHKHVGGEWYILDNEEITTAPTD